MPLSHIEHYLVAADDMVATVKIIPFAAPSAVVLGLAFAWRETHTPAPMLDLSLFRSRRFTAAR